MMIYPDNYERKIGFEDIRRMLRGDCLCQLGCDEVDQMEFKADADEVRARLAEVREFRRMLEEEDDFPLQYFFKAFFNSGLNETISSLSVLLCIKV